MNYLAHLSLSFGDPGLMLGNFIADNIPRKEELQLPKDILKGVVLHRKIDRFTDNHPSFKRAVRKLRPHHRKYAPVVIDILNDHLLARNWDDFHGQQLTEFQAEVYNNFEQNVDRLPPKASLHVYALLEYQYLKVYESKKGLSGVLKRMDKRTRFPSDFESAVIHLYNELDFFNSEFIALYHGLIEFIKSQKRTREVR